MKKTLIESNSGVVKRLNKLFVIIFPLFIFSVLTFSRAFTIINVGNIYVTEIVLFLSLFFLAYNLKDVFGIPVNLLLFLSAYFIFCSLRLAADTIGGNFYALRGVVYFGYTLFFPATFIIFPNKNSLKKLIVIFIASNIIGLLLVRFCIYRQQPVIPGLIYWWGQMKAFNYVLYFAFAQTFLICFYALAKTRASKFLIVLLCSLNSYMIFIWGIRSSWAAFMVLFPFLLLMLKRKFFHFLIYFIPVFLILAGTLWFSLDRDVFKEDVFVTKLQSLNLFIESSVTKNRPLAATIKKILKKEQLPEIRKTLPLEENIVAEEKPKINAVPTQGAHSNDKNIQPLKSVEQPKYEDPFLKEDITADENLILTRRQDRINYFSNIQWRISLWKAALRSGMESPIIGKGFGIDVRHNYSVSYKVSAIKPKAFIIPIHNHIISIFYKTGIIGLGLFLLINIYSFFYGLNYLKECKTEFTKYFLIALLGCLIFWHTMALFFDVIDSPSTSVFLWIILGLIFACVHADRKILDTAKYEQP